MQVVQELGLHLSPRGDSTLDSALYILTESRCSWSHSGPGQAHLWVTSCAESAPEIAGPGMGLSGTKLSHLQQPQWGRLAVGGDFPQSAFVASPILAVKVVDMVDAGTFLRFSRCRSKFSRGIWSYRSTAGR